MLEGAFYCLLVALWTFIGAAREEDRAGAMILTIVATLLTGRGLWVAFQAVMARNGLL